MVRLSPKALRFAESVVEHVANAHGFRPDRQRVWRTWSGRISTGNPPFPQRLQDHYVEVPNPVATMFLDAIGEALGAMDRRTVASEDPDLENDLEFLQAIKSSLERELGRPVRE
jgi:hypothetical protein